LTPLSDPLGLHLMLEGAKRDCGIGTIAGYMDQRWLHC
jgi:hypothetical protein